MKTRSGRIKYYVLLLRETLQRWRALRPELLAGGLAYFAILSATPLMLILIGVLRLVVAKANVMAQLDVILSPRMGNIVRELLLPAHGSSLATLTIFSSLVLIYGAAQIFGQLRASLDLIWEVPVKVRPSWRELLKSSVAQLVMIMAACLFILVFVLLDVGVGIASRFFGTALPGLGPATFWNIASLLCSLVLFTLLFGVIFRWLPSRVLHWRDVWPGAVLTSVLFALGKFILALYFSWLSFDTLSGTAGALVVIMVWVYGSAQIFFFGAVFTRVYAQKRED